MALNRQELRRYLLGMTSAAEVEEMEVRVIEDEGLTNDLEVAESELIEDFLEGTLTNAERENFEKHFLVSEQRRERVNEIRLLKRFSSGPHRFDLTKVDRQKTSWFGTWWLVPAFCVLILAIAGLGIWQFAGNGLSSIEREYAELNKKNLADPAEVSGFQSATIAPGTFRNAGPVTVVEMSGRGKGVLFRLPLSFDVAADARFQGALIANDARFSIDEVRIYADGSVKEFRFLAPRSALRKGQNRIELAKKGSTDAPVVYIFEAR